MKCLLARHVQSKYCFLFLVQLWTCNLTSGQNYISYFTGDTSDVQRTTQPGTVLMGGSTENDSAMVWWLKRSGGGDVLVIRASGSNGYNDYLYSQLGQTVNSVESIVCQSRQNSYDPYVLRRLKEAEALWIAGGDQGKYTSYWKGTPVDSLINYLINVKKIPVGGTSAGMAIMGDAYFDALQGSVTSAQALANPYDPLISIGRSDFIHNPLIPQVITDTHFDNPDRRGRMVTFLARLATDSGFYYKGIACEEKAAVCIDSQGIGRVFGNNPATEFANFVQVNCIGSTLPETCLPNQPLTWNVDGKALLVYKVPGTNGGTNTFDMNNWQTGSGGAWQYWSALNGQFSVTNAPANPCVTSVDASLNGDLIKLSPNPTNDHLILSNLPLGAEIRIWNSLAQVQLIQLSDSVSGEISVHNLSAGMYTVEVKSLHSKVFRERFVKE